MLVVITSEGGGAGGGEARAGTGCEAGLPFCSLAVTTLLGAESDPKLLEKKPWGSGQADSVLSVFFSLSPHWDPCSRAGGVLKQGRPMHRQRSDALPVQVPASPLSCSLSCKSPLSLTANHCPNFCHPYPVLEMLHRVVGPMWTLGVYREVSRGRVAEVRDLGYFWIAAWTSIHDGHCCPTQAPLQEWVASVSQGWVFSPVVVAPDPVLHCGVSGVRAFGWLVLGCLARQLQETWQLLKQTSLCPASGASQWACAPCEQSLGFTQPFCLFQ